MEDHVDKIVDGIEEGKDKAIEEATSHIGKYVMLGLVTGISAVFGFSTLDATALAEYMVYTVLAVASALILVITRKNANKNKVHETDKVRMAHNHVKVVEFYSGEVKRVERRFEDRLSNLEKHAPYAYLELRLRDGYVLNINEKLTHQYGWTLEDLRATQLTDDYRLNSSLIAAMLVHPDGLIDVLELIKNRVSGFVGSKILNLFFLKKGANAIPVLVESTIIKESNEDIVQLFIYDKTDEKAMEEALNAYKGLTKSIIEQHYHVTSRARIFSDLLKEVDKI